MAQINIRIDDDLKNRADELFSELGLNMSTAVNIFIRQTVRQGGIPFDITVKSDPFYSVTNQEYLMQVIEKYDLGKSTPIRKTITELEEMTND